VLSEIENRRVNAWWGESSVLYGEQKPESRKGRRAGKGRERRKEEEKESEGKRKEQERKE
jgi:hypothetical protein